MEPSKELKIDSGEGVAMAAKCIFCRIIRGEIPAHRIYEDEAVLAFLDIGPVVTGHVLVVPKVHYKNIFDIPESNIAAVSARLPRLARAVAAAAGAASCHVLINNGSEAMQSVLHLHYHIIPRRLGDGFNVPWCPGNLSKERADELVSAITEALRHDQHE